MSEKLNRTLTESTHLADGTTIIPLTNNKIAIIDTEDFDKVKNYTWYYQNTAGYYSIKATTRDSNYKTIKILLHKLILDFPAYDVKYIDGDWLNNRRSNLKLSNRKCRPSKIVSFLNPTDPPSRDMTYKKLDRTLEESIHQEDGTTLIPLTNGFFVIIDTIDFDLVKDFTWTLSKPKDSNTYYATTIIYHEDGSKEFLRLHRVLFGKEADGFEIDHSDLDGLNNRRKNLRLCTPGQNTRNIAPRKNNKSGVNGVRWDERSKRWLAAIRKEGKNTNLGSFKTKEEASQARWAAEKEIDAEFYRGYKNG